MMRWLLRLTMLALLAWSVWVAYQYATKASTAKRLLEEQMQEISAMPFETLVERLGRGEERKTLTIDGKTYWLRWVVRTPNELLAASGAKGPAALKVQMVQAYVFAEYLELVPRTKLRAGPSAQFTVGVGEGPAGSVRFDQPL